MLCYHVISQRSEFFFLNIFLYFVTDLKRLEAHTICNSGDYSTRVLSCYSILLKTQPCIVKYPGMFILALHRLHLSNYHVQRAVDNTHQQPYSKLLHNTSLSRGLNCIKSFIIRRYPVHSIYLINEDRLKAGEA